MLFLHLSRKTLIGKFSLVNFIPPKEKSQNAAI